VAKYRFGGRIGSGGFAEVIECTRLDDGATNLVAKRLLSRDAEQVKRFAREIRMQSTLSHPNVTPILGKNLVADPPWAILPRAESNMRDMIRGRAGDDLVWMVMQAATGLMHAHANGIIHRDLKPENILAFKESNGVIRMCVADFGLGRFVDRDSTQITLVNMGLGTLAYMAPEQLTDAANSDARADVYAVGKLLYEVLTGLLPYPSVDLTTVPSRFRFVVQKATQQDVNRRYQSMEALVKDMEVVSAHPEQLTKPTEAIKSIIRKLPVGSTPKQAETEAIARLLLENLDDNSVLLSELPALPREVLAALCAHCEPEMEQILEAYDTEISGSISFGYCDTAADFLESVWAVSQSDKIRTIIVTRLVHMGADNNRWHVGNVLGRVAAGLKSGDPAMLALRDALAASPRAREFNRAYLTDVGLPKIIRGVLNSA
jgi:eukaryotic-like serine/threonine-protein kinase